MQVIFSDPYYHASLNRHTSPQLDQLANDFTEKEELKAHVGVLKHKFETAQEALIHGDLHTGSLMVTADNTYVLDHEFAFYGPIGFDIGAFICHLLMAYIASYGHEEERGATRNEQRQWLASTVAELWRTFAERFKALWTEAVREDKSGASLKSVFGERSQGLESIQDEVMDQMWRDALGYGGCKMIRRVLGVAHVADLEKIQDKDRRSRCEEAVLSLAETMVLQGHKLGTISSPEEIISNIKARP
jgi:5-methylthioribose kinase